MRWPSRRADLNFPVGHERSFKLAGQISRYRPVLQRLLPGALITQPAECVTIPVGTVRLGRLSGRSHHDWDCSKALSTSVCDEHKPCAGQTNADKVRFESHTETRTPPEGGAVVVAVVVGVYLKLAVPLGLTST
jgi:hypothetical protein